MDCIFCKIVNGEIPCYKIYENDLVLAFLDISPKSNGHTLIVPKTHYKDIDDIPNDILTNIFDTARIIKKKLEDKLNIDGIALTQNNGEIQEVKHFHLHLIPYYKNSKLSEVEEVYKKIEE